MGEGRASLGSDRVRRFLLAYSDVFVALALVLWPLGLMAAYLEAASGVVGSIVIGIMVGVVGTVVLVARHRARGGLTLAAMTVAGAVAGWASLLSVLDAPRSPLLLIAVALGVVIAVAGTAIDVFGSPRQASDFGQSARLHRSRALRRTVAIPGRVLGVSRIWPRIARCRIRGYCRDGGRACLGVRGLTPVPCRSSVQQWRRTDGASAVSYKERMIGRP